MVAVGDHLERAQMLLVEVMNQEAEGSVDVSQTKRLAQDLVQSNRLYRQTALRNGEPGMANVLDELERVLLHISHSPNEISAEDLASLQHQIAAQGILFKVRVVELQAQEKQKAAGPRMPGSTL
jgi:polyhydroxyalkanoate synthesis regulator phasin